MPSEEPSENQQRKKAKRKKRVKKARRQSELEDEIHLHEEDKIEPFLGGFNSQASSMLTVTFDKARDGRQFKEMVEDFQTILLTGGV